MMEAMLDPMQEFGKWLKRRRRSLGLTQVELGRRTGYASETLRKIEAGEQRPSRQMAEKLAEHLNILPDEKERFLSFARGATDANQPLPPLTPAPPAALPPAEPRRPAPLPAELSSFIGREAELATLIQLVRRPDVRLVTVTGPPGIGKTRLALQAAERLSTDYAGDIIFVGLTPIRDQNLVIPTVARALGIPEIAGQPLLDTIEAALRERYMLLLLDNFEQVSSAAPGVSSLLAAAPFVTALVTSQVVLDVRGEHVFVVPAMARPDLQQLAAGDDPAATLGQYEAVQLFVARAVARKPDFALTGGNAREVAEICQALDGLPLAIELAAARSIMFPPRTMLDALRVNRLQPLKGGTQDAPERHRTLRAAIAWSYSLLSEAEQRLFRRLAVFLGGFTLEAVSAVCDMDGDLGVEVADGLESLINKSLAWVADTAEGEPRYWQLSTIHEYASELLAESGESGEQRRRHAGFYAALAATSRPLLHGPEQAAWLNRLESDYDNFRLALQWSCEASEAGELALRLAGDLGLFWQMRGHLSEGRDWIGRVLRADTALQPAEARIIALNEAGNLAQLQGDYASAGQSYEEALGASRQSGNRLREMYLLINLAAVALERGHCDRARTYLEESLASQRRDANKVGMAIALLHLGEVARCEDDYAAAEKFYLESLALFQEIEDAGAAAWTLHNLAYVSRHRGDHERAAALFLESLNLFQPLGYQRGLVACLAGFAGVAADRGNAKLAAQLLGAAASQQESLGISTEPADRRQRDTDVAAVQTRMPGPAFDAAWLDGRSMTLEQALVMARAIGEPAPDDVGESTDTHR